MTRKQLPLAEYHVRNFRTVLQAADNADLALVQCRETKTGKLRAVIATIHKDEDGLYVITPFAVMIEGDPFSQFDPPGQFDADPKTLAENGLGIANQGGNTLGNSDASAIVAPPKDKPE